MNSAPTPHHEDPTHPVLSMVCLALAACTGGSQDDEDVGEADQANSVEREVLATPFLAEVSAYFADKQLTFGDASPRASSFLDKMGAEARPLLVMARTKPQAAHLLLVASLVSSLTGCGGPCDDYCEYAMQRLVDCNVLLDTETALEEEVDACVQYAEDAYVDDEECKQSQVVFEDATCDDLRRAFCGIPDPYVVCHTPPPPPPPCPRDDENPCTEDLCEDGTPVFVPLPMGPRPLSEQTVYDCTVLACDGEGHIAILAADDDLEYDDNPCTKEWCSAGQRYSEILPFATVCDAALGFVCIEGVCRPPCTATDMSFYAGAPIPSLFNDPPQPHSVVDADLTGDGITDLVVLTQEGTAVLLGLGDGNFDAAIEYTMPFWVRGVTAVDLSGDGLRDLVVSGGAAVHVLLNQGEGSFAPPIEYPHDQSPQVVTAADLDGDGDFDLATGSDLGNRISVMLNQGDGSFAPPVHTPVGAVTQIGTADLNGDGKLDLVYTAGSMVSVSLNEGGGTFGPTTSVGLGDTFVFADLNGDGKLDLAAANTSTKGALVWMGNGDGTFGASSAYAAGLLPSPKAITAADLDGDGKLDLAALKTNTSFASEVLVLRNNGNGTFAAPVTYGEVGDDAARSLTALDLDGDARPELAVANGEYAGLDVLRNAGNGTFASQKARIPLHPPVGAAFLPGTKKLAIVNNDKLGVYSVFLGGMFDGAFVEVGNHPQAVASGHLNNDNWADIVTANVGASDVSVRLSGGSSAVHHLVGSKPRSVALSDVDGDGHIDIITANAGSDDVSVLFNNGDGTFAPFVPYAAGSKPRFVTAADVTGDDKPDLVVASQGSDTVNVLVNQGEGSFGAPIAHAVGKGPRAIAVADLNGDQKPDLAVASDAANQVYVLFNEGGGTFAAAIPIAAGVHPWSIVAMDANTDTIVDLVVANHGTFADPGDVTFLYNSGNGTFAAPIHMLAGTNPTWIAASSLNADVLLDLAITNGGGQRLMSVLGSQCK